MMDDKKWISLNEKARRKGRGSARIVAPLDRCTVAIYPPSNNRPGHCGRLQVRLPLALATEMGWSVGDRIEVLVDKSTGDMALRPSPQGNRLTKNGKSGVTLRVIAAWISPISETVPAQEAEHQRLFGMLVLRGLSLPFGGGE